MRKPPEDKLVAGTPPPTPTPTPSANQPPPPDTPQRPAEPTNQSAATGATLGTAQPTNQSAGGGRFEGPAPTNRPAGSGAPPHAAEPTAQPPGAWPAHYAAEPTNQSTGGGRFEGSAPTNRPAGGGAALGASEPTNQSAGGGATPHGTEPTNQSAGGGGRDAALDGIRGLAALGVWLLHVGGNTGVIYRDGMFAWMTTRLGIAVPIFFLLSGLLLFRPWAKAFVEGGRAPGTPRYLWRRLLRVFPAYWLVTALALWAWSSLDGYGWATWMLMLQNYTGQGQAPDGLYQMWTMPIELAFYLALPLIAWCLGVWARRGNRAVRLLGGIAVLPVISIATVVAAHVWDQPQLALWLPHHLIYFAAGMAMAVLSVWIKESRALDSLAPQLLVLAVLLYAMLSTELAGPRTLTLPSLSQSLWRMMLETAVAVLVVAPFALAPRTDSLRHRVLGNPVSAYLGRISYSVFLWHAPVITLYYKVTDAEPFNGNFWPVATFTLIGTLLISAGSYHLVEENALRLSGLRRRVPVPPPEPPAREPSGAAR
ncbi:acyltransferase family protein [Nonomuraea sp. NPDC059023]|uniref:acyltransferase family protein n=1 Tax=unclassified Nonomuraea TaxID=2593643 RepID=UPI0036790F1D